MRLPYPYRAEADVVEQRLHSLKGALSWAEAAQVAEPGKPQFPQCARQVRPCSSHGTRQYDRTGPCGGTATRSCGRKWRPP